jgi:hypothetical protein
MTIKVDEGRCGGGIICIGSVGAAVRPKWRSYSIRHQATFMPIHRVQSFPIAPSIPMTDAITTCRMYLTFTTFGSIVASLS